MRQARSRRASWTNNGPYLCSSCFPRKIEVKLVLLDFYRTIPADKRNEVLGNIDKQVEKQFFDAQVPVLQEQLEVESLTELDNKLRSFGTSIGTQKAEFREQMIARTIIGHKINRIPGNHA